MDLFMLVFALLCERSIASHFVPAWYALLEATRGVFLYSIRKDITVCFIHLVGVSGGGCLVVLSCGVDVGEVSPVGLAKGPPPHRFSLGWLDQQ